MSLQISDLISMVTIIASVDHSCEQQIWEINCILSSIVIQGIEHVES